MSLLKERCSQSSIRHSAVLGLLLGPFLILLTACSSAPHQVYHPCSSCVEEKNEGRYKQPYDLAYIEFDDQGEFWEPDQLDRALQMIDRVNMSAGYDKDHNSIGSIFVTFVHGWRNNADKGNGNLNNFKMILERLVDDEELAANAAGRPPRPVAGIYVAWRGDALQTTPLLRWLDVFTFWNRNATALRIASRPPATQALLLVLKEIQGKDNARSIVVGHSMGALILERAISQALVGIITEAKYRPGCEQCQCKECCETCPEAFAPGKFKPPADLIVLVNSAAPALHSKHLVEVLEEDMKEEDRLKKPPILVSITAQNDRATKRLFPIAMALESRRQIFRDKQPEDQETSTEKVGLKEPDQRYFVTHTAGHTPFLQSHERLIYDRNGTCAGTADRLALNVSRCQSAEGMRELIFTVGRRKYTIRPVQNAMNRTPYWILQAPPTVIDDHSGFFNEDFINFLRGLIVATGATRPLDTQRTYSTEVGTKVESSEER